MFVYKFVQGVAVFLCFYYSHFFVFPRVTVGLCVTTTLATQRLHCWVAFFVWKLKSGYIITTGQYMNYQSISNLQFRPLLENSIQSSHIDLKDTSCERIPFVSVGITRLVLRF